MGDCTFLNELSNVLSPCVPYYFRTLFSFLLFIYTHHTYNVVYIDDFEHSCALDITKFFPILFFFSFLFFVFANTHTHELTICIAVCDLIALFMYLMQCNEYRIDEQRGYDTMKVWK